jgi:hypothetical protein
MVLTDLVKHTLINTLQKKRLNQLSKIAQRMDTTRLTLAVTRWPNIAFPITQQGQRNKWGFRSSILSLYLPLSTLNHRHY